jgi:hypothetical protein
MRSARATGLPELLQWFGLLGAALAWTGQLVVGFGVTDAACSAGGADWGLDVHAWEIALTAAGVAAAVLAGAAALAVFLETRGVEEEGPPPAARRHFFAAAALVGNTVFLGAIVLTGVGALTHSPCAQA